MDRLIFSYVLADQSAHTNIPRLNIGKGFSNSMSLKRIRSAAIIFTLVLLGIIGFSKVTDHDRKCVQTMSSSVESDMYEEALIVSLLNTLQQASNRYYEGSYPVLPTVELDTTELEQIYKEKGKTILEFKIMPFTGPHNTVGIDHLTLSLDNNGHVLVLEYQHSDDF